MSDRDRLLEALAELGPEKATRPSDRELDDYLAGRLCPDAAENIRDLATRRPEVADRLLELAPFVAPEDPSETATMTGAADGSWRQLQERIDALEGPPAPTTTTPPGLLSARPLQHLFAGLAALFFLTTVGLLLKNRSPVAPHPAVANLRTLELVAGARGPEIQRLELPRGEPFRVVVHLEARTPGCETFAVELTTLEGDALDTIDGLRAERNRLELLLPAASGPTLLILSGCGETLETFRVDIMPR